MGRRETVWSAGSKAHGGRGPLWWKDDARSAVPRNGTKARQDKLPVLPQSVCSVEAGHRFESKSAPLKLDYIDQTGDPSKVPESGAAH